MNNNEVLKKLRVALQLRDDQIVDILKLANFNMEKSELNALFRSQDHPNYMDCGDQVLRNFLNGLIIHLRGTKDDPKNPNDVLAQNKKSVQENKDRNYKKDFSPKAKPSKKPFPASKKKNTATPIVEKVRFKNGKNKEA